MAASNRYFEREIKMLNGKLTEMTIWFIKLWNATVTELKQNL